MTEEELFSRFRPYCALLTTESSLECLERLRHLVEETDSSQLDLLQDYLIFPAQLHLKTKAGQTPANFTVAVLEYVQSLYSRVPLRSVFVFHDILSSCLGLVSSLKMTEDLQLHICSSLASLVVSGAKSGVLTEVYSEQDKAKLPLSHLLHSLLSWCDDVTLPAKVKVAALSLVSRLCQADRRQVGQVFVSLLPGVTSKLARLTQDVSTPPPVICWTVTAWTAFVTTSLSDCNFQTAAKTELSPPPLKPLDWLSEAQKQLVSHLETFQPLALHSDPRVRASVLQLAKDVLHWCHHTLEPGQENILRLVILLTEDQYNENCHQARIILRDLIKQSDEETIYKFNTFIKKNVFQLIKSLDTSIGLYESQKLMSNLTLLSGFMTYLCHPENNCDISLSLAQLRRLVQSLLVVSKFEERTKVIVATSNSGNVSSVDLLFEAGCLRSDKPDKQFLYLRSPQLVRQVESLCRTVGASSGLRTVTLLLTEAISELTEMRREALWVLTSVISGCEGAATEEDCDALKEVLRLYLSFTSQYEEAVEGVGVVCKVLADKIEVGRVVSEVLVRCDSVSVLHLCLQDVADGQVRSAADSRG